MLSYGAVGWGWYLRFPHKVLRAYARIEYGDAMGQYRLHRNIPSGKIQIVLVFLQIVE